MSTEKLSAAELEQRYLRQNATLMLMVGLLWLADIGYSVFGNNVLLSLPSDNWLASILALSLVLVFLFLFAWLVYTLIQCLGHAGRKVFWTNHFSDEWLAHLNTKGYRGTGYVLISLLLITFVGARVDLLHTWLVDIDIFTYSKALLAAGSIAYAGPVFCGLRGD